MNVNLVPTNVFGRTEYRDTENKITASQINGKWYATIDTNLFDAGFTNIACLTEFLSKLDGYEETLSIYGCFQRGSKSAYSCMIDPRFNCTISVLDEGFFGVDAEITNESGFKKKAKYVSEDFGDVMDFITNLMDAYSIDIFSSVILSDSKDTQYVIEAKMTSRDLAKNLVRVKSSNIWAYGINIRDRKDKKGDMLIQFKSETGGAGDMYIYYDVDIFKTWRKFLSAASKGHFFWTNVRNVYKYSKLTGDKKGKLPNAINH